MIYCDVTHLRLQTLQSSLSPVVVVPPEAEWCVNKPVLRQFIDFSISPAIGPALVYYAVVVVVHSVLLVTLVLLVVSQVVTVAVRSDFADRNFVNHPLSKMLATRVIL